MKKQRITKETAALALGIALLPPLWAVLSPYIGVTTGSVALICAGVYVANGNRAKDGLKISLGFLCGDIWAVAALALLAALPWGAAASLFVTLFVLGGAAVLLAALAPRFLYLPAWLCGWAVGMTILAPLGLAEIGSLPVQIGVSMLIGVWYVGFGVDAFQKMLLKDRRPAKDKI